MSRAAVARLAAKALPRRADNHSEVVGTMLDAGERSRRAFTVEVLSVTTAGLLDRARATAAQPAGGLLRAALGWAAVVSLARLLGIALYAGFELRWPVRLQPIALAYVLPALVLLLWTVGQRRTAGLVGVIWGAWYLTTAWTRVGFDPFVDILIPAFGLVIIAASPGRDVPPHRLFWLTAGVLLAINPVLVHSVVFGIVVLGVALCLIPLAPAFGLGTALSGSIAALNGVIITASLSPALTTELIACPLLALMIIAGMKRLLPTRF